MYTKSLITVADDKVWASTKQAEVIAVLGQTRKGGFARIYGYKPTTNYEVPPVQDIVMVTRFSIKKLYERKSAALGLVTFDSVRDLISEDPKLSELSLSEQKTLFDSTLDGMLESLSKSLSGDRSDARRQGHDRCFLTLTEGVKVNYDTEKGKDGLMHPVLTDGFPTVSSIMLTYLENSKTTRVPGVRKVVNSRPPKRMSNVLESVLNKRSVGIKTASLKEDNFERLVIDNEVILREDVVGLV